MLAHGRKERFRPSRVVILGAKGFVASALAKSLADEGVIVLAIGSDSIDLTDPKAPKCLTDAIHAEDVVVMTAALTPDKGRDVSAFVKNVRMAEHVAAVVKSCLFAQLIYVSSDAVYDSSALPITEATPSSPGDLYGLMHRVREVILKEAAGKANLPFCVLRPCAIYGHGDTHNSYGPNRFIRTSIRERKIQIFGLGEEMRDHVYIDDVINLMKEAIDHCSTGALNVVSGEMVSFGDLARQIVKITGGTANIESLPRTSAVTHRIFDPAAIKRSFPDHIPTRLEIGLISTVAAFNDA
jgi:UDP-glucose 4-epimerase